MLASRDLWSQTRRLQIKQTPPFTAYSSSAAVIRHSAHVHTTTFSQRKPCFLRLSRAVEQQCRCCSWSEQTHRAQTLPLTPPSSGSSRRTARTYLRELSLWHSRTFFPQRLLLNVPISYISPGRKYSKITYWFTNAWSAPGAPEAHQQDPQRSPRFDSDHTTFPRAHSSHPSALLPEDRSEKHSKHGTCRSETAAAPAALRRSAAPWHRAALRHLPAPRDRPRSLGHSAHPTASGGVREGEIKSPRRLGKRPAAWLPARRRSALLRSPPASHPRQKGSIKRGSPDRAASHRPNERSSAPGRAGRGTAAPTARSPPAERSRPSPNQQRALPRETRRCRVRPSGRRPGEKRGKRPHFTSGFSGGSSPDRPPQRSPIAIPEPAALRKSPTALTAAAPYPYLYRHPRCLRAGRRPSRLQSCEAAARRAPSPSSSAPACQRGRGREGAAGARSGAAPESFRLEKSCGSSNPAPQRHALLRLRGGDRALWAAVPVQNRAVWE